MHPTQGTERPKPAAATVGLETGKKERTGKNKGREQSRDR